MTIKELYTERKRIHEAMLAIQRKADEEKRSMNAEETQTWERANADFDAMTKDIERREKMDAAAKILDAPVNTPPAEKRDKNNHNDGPELSSDERNEKEAQAFRLWARGGEAALSSRPELRAFMRRNNESRTVSYSAQTETTTGGGYLLPTLFSGELEKALKAFGGVRSVARILTTPTGATINWPTVDDTSYTGEKVDINTEISAQAVTYGNVPIYAYKYSSKGVLVPIELLQDSAFPLESHLRDLLVERLGRITNTAFTTGDGNGDPQGVTVGPATGVTGAVGTNLSITNDGLLDLIHSLNSAYRRNARFMFSDLSFKAIKKLVDDMGRPLWLPSVIGGAPDTIHGYPYTINDDMATMAAGEKSVLFADFSKYIVRDVMPPELYRLSEKYIESGQVAFVAFMRCDARWINTGAAKVYVNGAAS